MGTEVQQALVFYDNNTSNDIYSQLFVNNLFGSVRSIIMPDNSIWFVAGEVASCLGYTNPMKAIRDHVRDKYKYFLRVNDSFTLNLDMGGNNRYGIMLINEPGVYQLVMRSKLPAAEQFADWVFEQVLPAMRQIGFTKSMSILREENERLKQEILNKDNQIYELNTRIDSMHNNILKDNYNIDNIYNSNLSDKEKYILLNDM